MTDTNISLPPVSLGRQEELKDYRFLSGVIKKDSTVGARMGKLETRKKFQFQTLTGRPPRNRLYGMVILKWILSKYSIEAT